MKKRAMLVLVMFLLVGMGLVVGQDRVAKAKELMMQRIVVGPLVLKPDLRPGVAVYCCNDGCGGVLGTKGFLFATSLEVIVYNAGGAASNPGTVKVEFFNHLTCSNMTISYSIPAIAKKEWAPAHTISGPFLVKAVTGIKLSVTFTGPGVATAITNTHTEKSCLTIY
jgi:hypothetical protein